MAKPLIPIPPSWDTITLDADPKRGFIATVDSGGTPSTGEETYWDGGIPWLTPKEITADGSPLYISHTERTISAEGLANSGAKLLPAGTVMLTKRAPVGAVAVAAVPICTNQGFMNFVCGQRLNPLYLAFWLKANTEYLNAVANGSTYPELYKNDLFEFQMGVPSISDQNHIVQVFLALQKLMLACNMAEQSAETPAQVTEIQARSRRLWQLRDRLGWYLLAGLLEPAQPEVLTLCRSANER